MRRRRVASVLAVVLGAAWLASSCAAPETLVTLKLATCADHTVTYTLTDDSAYPLDVNYVSDANVHLSSTHVDALGGTATVTAPTSSTSFQIWYTFEGGPAPTSSSSTTRVFATVGPPVGELRTYALSSTPPPVASGIVVMDKFLCVGAPIT